MSRDQVLRTCEQLGPHVGQVKIGPKSQHRDGGLMLVRDVEAILGPGRIFYDDKVKNTPDELGELAAEMAAEPGIAMFNYHIDSAPEATAAVIANRGDKIDLGLTVLTTLKPATVIKYYKRTALTMVKLFATEAAELGARGVVCSAREAKMLLSKPATANLLLVTPGIRPKWSAVGQQVRVMTPYDAIQVGGDSMILVIGSPINSSKKYGFATPVDAIKAIVEEIWKARERRERSLARKLAKDLPAQLALALVR